MDKQATGADTGTYIRERGSRYKPLMWSPVCVCVCVCGGGGGVRGHPTLKSPEKWDFPYSEAKSACYNRELKHRRF